MTSRPTSLSPVCIALVAGAEPPGLNRRSKVIVEYSSLLEAPVAAAAEPAPTTLQSLAPPDGKLVSYWQVWDLPSPVILTVTFSHQSPTVRVGVAAETATGAAIKVRGINQ